MISGTTILLATLCLNATPASPPGIPPEASALVSSMARPVPSDTPYTEVRFVSVLKQPLILRGELHYGGPAELGKRVDSPYKETTTISGGQVEVVRDGRTARRFSLMRAPELESLLASFSALLGGDSDALAQNYSVTLRNAATWQMTLTPRSEALARHVREIIVDGSGKEPRCFSLNEADGDASVMMLGSLAQEKMPQPLTRAAVESMCGRP
jgi:Outer membrane lipoprotein carrier protein LolA-like